MLLDTDVDGNSEENRQLAARLYFGDQRIRIRQELLLGVGGVRALRAAGIHWGGLHLNEGHSAFATLEYTRLLMELTGADFADLRAGGRPEHRVHDAHAGRRRATIASRPSWSTTTWNRCAARWACRSTSSWVSAASAPRITARRCA